MYGQRAADVRSATAIHDAVVLDQIANGADGIVKGTFCLIDNLGLAMMISTGSERETTHHFVAPADKYGHGAGVGTFLDDDHLIPRGAKRNFPDDSRLSELLRCQVLESWDDAALGGDGNQLGKDHNS